MTHSPDPSPSDPRPTRSDASSGQSLPVHAADASSAPAQTGSRTPSGPGRNRAQDAPQRAGPDVAPPAERPWQAFARPPATRPGKRAPATAPDEEASGSSLARPVLVQPAPHRCTNCASRRTGPYCANCGHRHRTRRLTVRRFLRDLSRRLFDLESGFWVTVRTLTTAPGQVSQDYVAGRGERYLRPGTYLILVITLSVFAFAFVEDAYTDYFLNSLTQAALQPGAVDGVALQEVAATATRWISQGSLYLTLFIAAAFGVLARILVPGWGQAFTVAESTVFALYTTSHGYLLTLFLYPLAWFTINGVSGAIILSYIMIAGIAVYVTVAARRFFRSTWAVTAMVLITYGIVQVVFGLIAGIIGFALGFALHL